MSKKHRKKSSRGAQETQNFQASQKSHENPNPKDGTSPRRNLKVDSKERAEKVAAMNKVSPENMDRIMRIKAGTKDRREQAEFRSWLREALHLSYREARKGKRSTVDEHKIEIKIDENIEKLCTAIILGTYQPGRSRAHIILKPVIREIFSASFLDRIVHHFVFMMVYPWWDRHFIEDSYSCRIGKGTDYGMRRLQHHIRAVMAKTKEEVYVFKGDIQGYFMSLPRKKLLERAIWGLDQQFEGKQDTMLYTVLKFLWRRIIMDDPVAGAKKVGNKKLWRFLPQTKSLFKQKPGFGIVIGNLTSQLLSNIYLDLLDRFVTQRLGYKHYGRYVDDFYIIVTKSELPQLMRDLVAIEKYLASIGLTLHPKKRYLQLAKNGAEFIGARVFPYNIVPGKRVKKSVRKAFYEVEEGLRTPEAIASYLGHLKYFRSKEFIAECFESVGWEYNK